MVLAKARWIGKDKGCVRVGLSLPTGFDPEEVVQETVRGNDSIPPDAFFVEPRRGDPGDLFRELEVSFPEGAVANGAPPTLRITGRLRRGLPFTASLALSASRGTPPRDH